MRKLLTIVICVLAHNIFSQTDSTKKVSGYVSLGFSTSNGDNFRAASYLALESGVIYKNLGFGAILGRGNMVGFARKTDKIGKYYYELKTTAYFPISEIITGNVLFGWGGYFNSSHQLIEYGLGINYTHKKFSYGVMYSNWDAVNYITPNITFNF